MQMVWTLLAEHGADVVLDAHDHNYQRWEPIDGITSFVVGTGGARIRPVRGAQPNSEKRLDGPGDHGVLLLTLHPGSYEWQWIRTDGSTGDRSREPPACRPPGASQASGASAARGTIGVKSRLTRNSGRAFSRSRGALSTRL